MKKTLILIIAAVALGSGFWLYRKEFNKSYYTYAECVEKAGLPCRFWFVEDLGREWRPSVFKTKEECETSEPQVARTCLIPHGNFKEPRWIGPNDLVQAQLEVNSQKGLVQYQNIQYGFTFLLPEAWKGYLIVMDKWSGLEASEQGEKTVEQGPIILIRHPQWTSQNPRQDIPIMIFTIGQWNLLQQDKFHIGAAPIGPSELGRNSVYVFALPARYNYAFPTGWEEVEEILNKKPLQAF